MVTSEIINKNATALEIEFQWLFKVIETRLQIHFGHDCDYNDIFEIPPPEQSENSSMLGNFINYYELNLAERIVFLLALAPHVRPQILDVFFTKNASNSRDFTEFGHRNGHSYSGFIPTGETALFILAGDDLENRISFQYIFTADHYFNEHNILQLESTDDIEPELNGHLSLSREIVDLVTTGIIRKPVFSLDFPAKRIETAMDWNDLVLDAFTLDQVLEIKSWITYGNILLNDLGLGKKIKPGYRSLFYGPSGTGKTLTASLIGKETGLDVYRIDLSMIVSKYVGETEKNLEKIFSRAEHKNWILFFDEADALFGKRTGINDAHDRFANQEVSYLLQRVEDFGGIVILASNLKSNIDEAFTRRLQSIIHFPMPGIEERLKIWQNGFSQKTTFENNLNLIDIASKYELSGGAIMNVIRYVTLKALSNNSKLIKTEYLIEGIKKEFRKEGRTS